MTQTGSVAEGRLSDWISLGVLASWVPQDAVGEEDYEETWTRLSETLADWGCWDDSQGTVTTGGLTQARQRLGHEPVKQVFAQVARPVATEDTPGAFLGPW